MQAVVLPYTESRDLQMVLDLARRFKINYWVQEVEPMTTDDLKIVSENTDNHTIETLVIRQRLSDKYVKTGEWAAMDDDDRQDAVLGEMMLYADEDEELRQPAMPESETQQFLTDLKNGKYASHHQ